MSPRDIPVEDLPPSPGATVVSTPPAPPHPRPAILLLVAMTGLGPFTMQILIPCLPAMAVALAVPYGTVQLSLTLYLVGVAGGGSSSTARSRTASDGSRC